MRIIYAKHEPYWDTGHLGDVVEQMKTQGAPTIRVSDYNGRLCATEGSHRIASAHFLGITPKFVIELDEGCTDTSDFWDRVVERLPEYKFEQVLVLDLREFLK